MCRVTFDFSCYVTNISSQGDGFARRRHRLRSCRRTFGILHVESHEEVSSHTQLGCNHFSLRCCVEVLFQCRNTALLISVQLTCHIRSCKHDAATAPDFPLPIQTTFSVICGGPFISPAHHSTISVPSITRRAQTNAALPRKGGSGGPCSRLRKFEKNSSTICYKPQN